ncbi:hypothetical protein SEA_AMYEV_58 [Arthrobacter phage Amyev]|uniref:Uncharacterized protein n=1 Tax=Arthrobacter phage Amyev TaxID=2832315 RepID=A0AA49B3H6_9CAUD|nr:hypothetical protein PQD88_gp58 [Arthrobacter phage Amyev]UIW13473.1 hypothetical protein SEA_AMYEV_58 [Arthrobacter phage Amyev]
MAQRYAVISEGMLPAIGKLIRTTDDAVDAAVVATGTPTDMRLLAAKLNAAEALPATALPEE